MIHTLKLGGETRTLLFGNLAFRKMKEGAGITLKDIGEAMTNGDFTIVPTCLYYAMRAAERYEKRTAGDYDEDDVCMWMDLEKGVSIKVLTWIMDAITDLSGEEPPADGTKKKVKR